MVSERTDAVVPEKPTRRASSTVNELAARWGCEPQLIYRRIRRGNIRAFKVGALWRIPADEVARIEAIGPVVDEDGNPTDDIEAHIAALVAQAPPLTDEQRIRISALLLTGTGGAA
jgi:excisionase family DNA binding protein